VGTREEWNEATGIHRERKKREIRGETWWMHQQHRVVAAAQI